MNKLAFATPLLALAVAGCANLSPLTKARAIGNGPNQWLTYDSSRRGAYVLSEDGRTIICSEPAPDTAFDFTNKLEAAAKSPEVEASAKAELAAKAVALAGRDRIVLTAREALFRLCEAQANRTLRDGEYFHGFQEVMYTVRAMLDAEKAEAVKDVAKSSSDAAEALSKSFAPAPAPK